MTQYRIAIGHNVALVSMTLFSPQPRSEGVKITRRNYANNGIYDEGLYVELFWDYLEDASAYQTILNASGLLYAQLAAVTVYARNDAYTYVRYNGYAVRPEVGRDVGWNIFARNITLLIRDLVMV